MKPKIYSTNNSTFQVESDEIVTFGFLNSNVDNDNNDDNNDNNVDNNTSTSTHAHASFPIHTNGLFMAMSSNSRSDESPQELSMCVPSSVIDSCSSSFIESDSEGEGDSKHRKKRHNYKLKMPLKAVRETQSLNYCSRGLTGIDEGICGRLGQLQFLQLCCNQLSELPEEICHLKRLRSLDLSRNQLTRLPETLGYLQQLEELWLTSNHLTSLPGTLSGLQRLRRLGLAENEFTHVPRVVLMLNRKRLVTLELDRNPWLQVVPSEIALFSQLSRFHVDGCPRLLKESQFLEYERGHSSSTSPSLLECAARSLIRNRRPVLLSLPAHLKAFLSAADWCSMCEGPMMTSRVIKCRQIRRMDRPIPVIDELCCEHWKESGEARIKAILSPIPKTSPVRLIGQLDPTDASINRFTRFDPQVRARGERIISRFDPRKLGNLLVPLELIVQFPDYPVKIDCFD